MPSTPGRRGSGTRAALIVVAGGVASGKSTISRALADRIGASCLEADRIRGTLLSAATDEPVGVEARWRRDLSVQFEREIYADLLRRADAQLQTGRPLVLDACFPLHSQRAAARALATQRGVPFVFVHCSVPKSTLHGRIAERDRAAPRPVWQAIHDHLAQHSESLDDLSDSERIEITSDGPTGPSIDAIVSRLEEMPAVIESSPCAAIEPRPRVVSFDCWHTLLAEEDWPWAHSLRVLALQDAAREVDREVDRASAQRAFDAAWQQHMDAWAAGEATGAAEVARSALGGLGLGEPEPALTHLVRRFEEASHTGRVVALEGARELLAALGRSGIPCVLVCDTGLTPGRVVRLLLDRAGLLDHLSALAFSDEVGAPKPNARPYLAALAPLGVAPEHVMHVGDLRRTDVAGARELGMQTVRIRAVHDDRTSGPEADHVVDSHRALGALLGVGPFGITTDAA